MGVDDVFRVKASLGIEDLSHVSIARIDTVPVKQSAVALTPIITQSQGLVTVGRDLSS